MLSFRIHVNSFRFLAQKVAPIHLLEQPINYLSHEKVIYTFTPVVTKGSINSILYPKVVIKAVSNVLGGSLDSMKNKKRDYNKGD